MEGGGAAAGRVLLVQGDARRGVRRPAGVRGRWNGPRGYTEFGLDGRYEMAVAGSARMTGRYVVRDGGLVSITYDLLPGRDADAMRLTVKGDTLRLCDPVRPRLPCATLLRAGR